MDFGSTTNWKEMQNSREEKKEIRKIQPSS